MSPLKLISSRLPGVDQENQENREASCAKETNYRWTSVRATSTNLRGLPIASLIQARY